MKPPAEAHGLLCHYFHGLVSENESGGEEEEFPPAQGSLSVDDFERLLDAYGNRILEPKEWIYRSGFNGLGDEVCITFDDGLYESYALALPVLEARGLKACWNVYTGPYVGVPNNMELYRWVRNHGFGGIEGFHAKWKETVDKFWWTDSFYVGQERDYLTQDDKFFRQWREDRGPVVYEDTMDELVTAAGMDDVDRQWWMFPRQLRDLHRSGHVIGLHTHSHPADITKLSREHQMLEWLTSRAVLAGVLECDPKTITTASHPRGIADPGSFMLLASEGFTLAWGATMHGDAPWMTPRWSTGNWPL